MPTGPTRVWSSLRVVSKQHLQQLDLYSSQATPTPSPNPNPSPLSLALAPTLALARALALALTTDH